MCTILFSVKASEDYPLVIAANRDEFYGRPTLAAHWWEDQPNLLGGRDQQAGGTWFGITRSGRFATLTNFRVFPLIPDAPSRGELVSDFLKGEMSAAEYLENLQSKGHLYNGFNLLFGQVDDLWYYGNMDKDQELAGPVSHGIHGLSNALLDSPWPKVEAGKQDFADHLSNPEQEPSSILDRLFNPGIHPDELLPDTGIGIEGERPLSALFIRIPERKYGTRTSWHLTVSKDRRVSLIERAYEPNPSGLEDVRETVEFDFQLDPAPPTTE